MKPEQLSFRDPDGRVFLRGGRILREVEPSASARLLQFAASAIGQELVAEGRVIGSRQLTTAERDEALPGSLALVVEHPSIPFASYPYEWSPEMLLAAGNATLDLALTLNEHGLGLKDASAYNVLFDSCRPVFIDALSIEKRKPGNSRWLPYAQFQRHFVLPLLASRYFGHRLAQTFLCCRDGLEPESLYPMLGAIRRLSPPFLGIVSLPTWLGQRRRGYDANLYAAETATDPERAQFVLGSTLRLLKRQLVASAPDRSASSTWT